jgi:FlaG/FlaF family flagellin (archaellin)
MNQKPQYLTLFVALFVAGLFKTFVFPSATSSSSPPNAQEVAETAAQTMNKLRSDALAQHPGMPESQAVDLEAKARASTLLESASEANKMPVAASQFLGFYYANATVLPEICQSGGVDISSYVQAFKQEHVNVFRTAQKVLAESNLHATPEQIQGVFAAEKPQMVPLLTQRVRDLAASQHKTSVQDGCRYIAEHGETLARGQLISTVEPGVYRVLTSQ